MFQISPVSSTTVEKSITQKRVKIMFVNYFEPEKEHVGSDFEGKVMITMYVDLIEGTGDRIGEDSIEH